MSEKIRVGLIGANSKLGWAARSHLPAIAASLDVELTAACTTRLDSAQETADRYGAQYAFSDYREMLAQAELDAVMVSVRVPSHFEPTRDAIAASVPVYTEWPLGRTTEEAVELTALAKSHDLPTAVGLQSRMNPALLYMRDLIADGYVGEVLTCHVSLVRGGNLERTSDRTWQRDASLGANTLTISNGHALDALIFLVGNVAKVSSVVETGVSEWWESDTERSVDVTSPDTVLTSGRLVNGGVYSSFVASVPWSGSGYRLEIYGREGTLRFACEDSPQRDRITLYGARGTEDAQVLEVPAKYVFVPETMPSGAPYCLGQLYHQFAISIRGGVGDHPVFDDAVAVHRLIDAVTAASTSGRETEVVGVS